MGGDGGADYWRVLSNRTAAYSSNKKQSSIFFPLIFFHLAILISNFFKNDSKYGDFFIRDNYEHNRTETKAISPFSNGCTRSKLASTRSQKKFPQFGASRKEQT
jgi:hypothetical protein